MKNRKLIASGLCLFIFILSFSHFINVGHAQAPNVEIISEAGITTRWDFLNETAGYDTIFYQPFDNISSNWDLYDVVDDSFIAFDSDSYLFDNITSISWDYTGVHFDVGVQDGAPTGITWDGTNFWVVGDTNDDAFNYTSAGVYTTNSFNVGVQDGNPEDICWDGTNFFVVGFATTEIYNYTSAGVYTDNHFDTNGQDNIPTGITWDGTNFFVVGASNDEVYNYTSAGVYTTNHFDVGAQDGAPTGIYWDGTYFWVLGFSTKEVYQYNATGDYTGFHFDVGTEDLTPQGITWDGTNFFIVGSSNDEVYQYGNLLDVSKKYQGSGYLYMQTNTSETLTLRSPNDLNLTLVEGDKIEIKFNTSSANRIDFNLRNNSIQQASYMLSIQGNGDFSTRTKTFTVGSNMSVDQMEFIGSFVDTKNLIIDYVKVIRSFSDIISYYVEPYGRRELGLGHPHNYTVEIYEHDNLKDTKYITTSATLQTLIYERIDGVIVYINYFDSNNEYLDFNNYITYVNYTLDGSTYTNKRLSSNILYVDKDTQIYFKIYDSFNALVKTTSQYEETFVDITLDVYNLKIKNEYQEPVFYELKNNDTEIIKSGNIFSEEIIKYSLASGIYIFNYTKDGDEASVNIDFSGHQILVINSSKMCFLTYVNQKGEYLFFNNYKTYVDGSLIYYNVFYGDAGDNVSVEIKDLYDISVKNHSFIVQTEDNYVPIILIQYSLKVMNQQEQFNHINITRDPNYYESEYYWSEWVAPNEIVKFRLFPGYYKINLTDNEGGSYSFYEYTLSGDDILLISSDNVLSQVIYNIANVNTTIGNQITNVEINITNQNSEINNTIVNIEINLSNVNSTLGNLLTDIDVNILNLESDIASLYTFTNTSIWNLNNAMNTSFIYLENNIYSINQSISTLVIGIDNSISLVNATITSMFTEMNQQFIVVQSTLDYSFAFLNQSVVQLANTITENHVILYNLIEQRANEIDSSLIDVQTLINLVNNTVADESLVIQTLVNLIGANITNNHIIINNLLNLIDNNITNNNIQLVSILEIIGNNITTNHFVIQTLLDVIGNNITYNHIELLTNLNLINTTISQNQIELINRLLFINNTINDMLFELTNQLLFLNGTIYNAVLNLSTSVEFGVDMVLGNITITYQQNEFLTELYKETMFSQLLNWSGVAYNYTLMEDRIDVWTFINNYKNQSIEVHLRYQDLIEKLVISADDLKEQYLPSKDVEYRLWSVADEEYIDEWEELDPKNKTVDFGFYETTIPEVPTPNIVESIFAWVMINTFAILGYIVINVILNLSKQNKRKKYIQNQQRQNMNIFQQLREEKKRRKKKFKRRKRR